MANAKSTPSSMPPLGQSEPLVPPLYQSSVYTIPDLDALDDIVLVALTGYGRAIDVQAAKDAGFDAHVTKPANSNAIDEILSNRAQRQKVC